MNTNLLPSPVSGRILLLVSPDSLAGELFEMVARLALQGPLYVLDGGNTFQGYFLARVLRRQTRDIAVPMRRVLLSRAFTCYQMSALLEGLLAERDFEPHPVLVLDFLGTFYDQDVRAPERRRLLHGCIRRLQALACRVPVAMWVRQRSVVPQEALPFLDMVQNAAGQVWYPPRQPALPALKQATLFPHY
jgi:hypothetical protein